MDDYLEVLVREGEEHVTDLNNALLEIESDPEDGDAMDAVFRTAHTLKGNFAAMGFEDAGDLVHALEDLLDAMRQGDLAVTGERMDRVFAGVDEVEACLDDIESHGEVQRDVSDTIASVRSALNEPDRGAPDGAKPEAVTGDVDGATGGSADGDWSAIESTDTENWSAIESTDTETQSVRVDVDRLDELHGLVEQLVTTRIRLQRGVGGDREVGDELDELEQISSELQDTVMDARLVPLGKVAGKFPRLVRDLAREQDKRVDFVVEGENVELDRTALTAVKDSLIHLLRNAVDHGIEPPAVRERNGKGPEGTVTLSAARERDRVRIEVSDDGSGIDPARVREAAVERGVVTRREAAELSEEETVDLVFHPGFSTNDEVTDVSGRGVGLDVVRDAVSRLDGSVEVSSEPGEGTTFTLWLPATVAVVTVLSVESGGEEYGIPLETVDGISGMRPVQRVDGEEVVTYGGDVYPLVRLRDALDVPGETRNGDGMLVRIRDAGRRVAIHCDDVRGQEEVVVRPFEATLSGVHGLSGATVLGEGDVVTVLDVEEL